MTLKILTLGGLQVEEDEEAVTGLVSNKAALLLVYLAWKPHHHPREILANLLWGHSEASQAMTNLRNVLSNIQKTLPGYLDVTRQTVALEQSSTVWIDAQQFMAQVKAFDAAIRGRPTPSHKMIENLEAALDLYRGDFLVGLNLHNSLELEKWVLEEQRSLRAEYVQSMKHVALHYLMRQDYEHGLAFASEMVKIDPWWEEGQRLLMELLVLSGRKVQAIQQYNDFAALLQEEFDTQPEARTDALLTSIKAGKLRPGSDATRRQIPVPLVSFVGRASEIERIITSLDNPACRLLTIAGIGGIGKTQLALRVAQQCQYDYLDGVHFVTIDDHNDGRALADKLVTLFQIFSDGDEEEALVSFLSDKDMLLIVDNAEFLVHQAGLLHSILQNTRHIKILVTSHEVLELQDEWVVNLGGLARPPADDDLSSGRDYDAIALFEMVAQQTLPEFDIAASLPEVLQICHLVDGSPMAIQIAARWVRTVPPAEIVRQIQENIDFLSTTFKDVEPRHRSIRVVLDHAWRLLSEDEKLSLMSLSVFQGSFGREAAEFVTQTGLATLNQLHNKALLQRVDDDSYILHDLVRRYAHEHLLQENLLEKVRFRHSEYFLHTLQRLSAMRQVELLSFEEINSLYDDILHALMWTEQQTILVFWCALLHHIHWSTHKIIDQKITPNLVQYAQRRQLDDETQAAFLFCKSEYLWVLGDVEGAKKALRDCIDLSERSSQAEVHMEAQILALEIAAFDGNDTEAVKLYEQITQGGAEADHLLAHARFCLGVSSLGFSNQSRELFSSRFYNLAHYPSFYMKLFGTLASFGSVYIHMLGMSAESSTVPENIPQYGDEYPANDISRFLNFLVQAGCLLGDTDQIHKFLIEAIKYGKQIQSQIQITYALLGFANIASVRADYPLAATLYAFLQKVDTIPDDYLRQQIDNALGFIAAQLAPDHYAKMIESGQTISSEQAVDMVLPQGMRALIIDNNSTDAMMLEQLLAIEGITAIRAISPEDALEKILQLSHVGIVFFDIGMSDNEENWLTSELTKDRRTRNTPIVAYTGSNQTRRAQEAGFDSLITKPIDIGSFALKLRQIMDG